MSKQEQKLIPAFNVDIFRGIKVNYQPVWLWAIWYGGLAAVIGFFSGWLYSPALVALGLTAWVIPPAGASISYMSYLQAATGLGYGGIMLGRLAIRTFEGHSQHFIPLTGRFDGDTYVWICFTIQESNIKEIPALVPGYHVFECNVAVPRPLGFWRSFANVFGGHYVTYEPIDTIMFLSEAGRGEVFRWHKGTAGYMDILQTAPNTCPLDASLYYAKKYEKNGKHVPVFMITGSPASVEKIQKLAGISGLTQDQLQKFDVAFDAHLAQEKDYRIEELENELMELKATTHSARVKAGQLAEHEKDWKGRALTDKSKGQGFNAWLKTKTGIVTLFAVGIFIVVVVALVRSGVIH